MLRAHAARGTRLHNIVLSSSDVVVVAVACEPAAASETTPTICTQFFRRCIVCAI